MNPAQDLPRLPLRAPDAHKGSFGLALVLGGSRGMAGAIALAGTAALRGGAGLVRLAVPETILPTVAGFEPSYMTVPLAADRAGRIALDAYPSILKLAETATAVAVGPGLGRSLGLTALVRRLYETLDKPLLLDADALNALASCREVLQRPAAPRVLTPHPGEFVRLVGLDRLPPEQREEQAAALAARLGVVIVLKGHHTLITDGQRQAINATGNPGMATGGSGDVLTGLVTSLLCQGLAPFDAAQLGVYLHGLAGDLAAAELSQEAMIASDLPRFLPAAFRQYRRQIAS